MARCRFYDFQQVEPTRFPPVGVPTIGSAAKRNAVYLSNFGGRTSPFAAIFAAETADEDVRPPEGRR